MGDPGNSIRDISDTALWVAIYRAMESERHDALFRDPYARGLGGERGEAIVNALPNGKAMAWPMIVRTAVMDEIILRCVAQGARSVLNLAAGLDTRPFRLPLPAALRWFHVDLPAMIGYVEEELGGEAPRCALQFVGVDLTDEARRSRVFAEAATAGPVLVLSEGLLVYLEPEQVADLARQLHSQVACRWWLTDLATPLLQKFLAKRWGERLAAGNAPMKFFPAEGPAFFAPHGWREIEFRSSWEESLRLGRSMRMARLWNLMGRFSSKKRREAARRMSGIVLFEREGQG